MLDQETIRQFREDGITVVRGCLSEKQLDACHEVFAWNVANPGPNNYRALDGTSLATHIDNANPNSKAKLDALVQELPFARIFQQLWGSEHVWYFAEEIFAKEGGKSGRGPFHQDTANLPWAGTHWGNAWISFHRLPAANSLQVVRGSWNGIEYDGASFADPGDPTDPLHDDGVLPRLPHIDRDLAKDPDAWDLVSFDVTPGDVVFLHPRSIHGGAHVDAQTPDRHTLVLRFFGDDATFRELPRTNPKHARNGFLFREEMAKLNQGEPFRSPIFQQIA
ncbi:phytanoyl-CoA dioxygenase family protein [Rhodococcus erythropolis]|uniref:phytanoyl-CoA dioxygenase family protein n=1 Tax=Rhodococcus erythropolis TaxID=1833 RepID=UPI001BE84226|nr:phytanoyl-CoA dioxygenase family protein [Rhodococcus erythropolis]MBT2263444.1 phytanoyl-CoA dioxygenase family protein [Rhodococcus erythropolis]